MGIKVNVRQWLELNFNFVFAGSGNYGKMRRIRLLLMENS
jgi:hypothetical protein